ncbi:hypothetical protein Tco_1484345 [Tanacetum coccineum]
MFLEAPHPRMPWFNLPHSYLRRHYYSYESSSSSSYPTRTLSDSVVETLFDHVCLNLCPVARLEAIRTLHCSASTYEHGHLPVLKGRHPFELHWTERPALMKIRAKPTENAPYCYKAESFDTLKETIQWVCGSKELGIELKAFADRGTMYAVLKSLVQALNYEIWGFAVQQILMFVTINSAIALCCMCSHFALKQLYPSPFIKEQVERNVVELVFRETKYQLALTFLRRLLPRRSASQHLLPCLELNNVTSDLE